MRTLIVLLVLLICRSVLRYLLLQSPMKLNDTTFDYLEEFYGSSAKWFAVYVLVASLFVILSNAFFIILTLTYHSLRKNVANWFLLGLSVSDQLHCMAHLVDAYALWNGSIDNRHWCSVAGLFVLSTGTCSFGFPALIAADRYYKISTISHSTGFSISNTILGRRNTLPLIISWFVLSAILNIPLFLNDVFGEDPSGFCGAKKFTSIPLLLSFEFSAIFVFSGSLIMTAIYYYRLAKWLKRHQASTGTSDKTVVYTRGIMRVMKIVTLLPVFTDTPVVILSAGQMILPVLPMWISRLLVVPYFLSSAASPWLTIGLVRQFRVRFLELASNVKNNVTGNIDILNNRSSGVRRGI